MYSAAATRQNCWEKPRRREGTAGRSQKPPSESQGKSRRREGEAAVGVPCVRVAVGVRSTVPACLSFGRAITSAATCAGPPCRRPRSRRRHTAAVRHRQHRSRRRRRASCGPGRRGRSAGRRGRTRRGRFGRRGLSRGHPVGARPAHRRPAAMDGLVRRGGKRPRLLDEGSSETGVAMYVFFSCCCPTYIDI